MLARHAHLAGRDPDERLTVDDAAGHASDATSHRERGDRRPRLRGPSATGQPSPPRSASRLRLATTADANVAIIRGVSGRETDVLLIADTHLGPGRGGDLTSALAGELAVADVVVHAGDVTDRSVLEAVSEAAPQADVHAVAGNLDGGLSLPERLSLDIAACAVAVVHDSGPAVGRRARLRRWFPDADLVVFGHSHLPWHDVDVRASDGHVQHHVNPGSPTLRRRAPTCSIAHVLLAEGAVAAVHHVPLTCVVPGRVAARRG